MCIIKQRGIKHFVCRVVSLISTGFMRLNFQRKAKQRVKKEPTQTRFLIRIVCSKHFTVLAETSWWLIKQTVALLSFQARLEPEGEGGLYKANCHSLNSSFTVRLHLNLQKYWYVDAFSSLLLNVDRTGFYDWTFQVNLHFFFVVDIFEVKKTN